MWPFRKKNSLLLDPVDLRNRLLAAAASDSRQKLRSECRAYKDQVAKHVDVISRLPDNIPKDDGSIDQHVQYLIVIAQCLANECSAPELWNKLLGDSDDNPIVQWNHWFNELPNRMWRLEYEALIAEAQAFLEKAKSLRGGAVRQQEVFLLGRLGELQFHSGQVQASLKPLRSALALCVEANDVEGQVAYLNNLIEAHRYLEDRQAVTTAEQLLAVKQRKGLMTEDVKKRLKLLKRGEPLCRVVCVRNGVELELDEITEVGEGRYKFQFRRNRPSLQKAIILTIKGKELASAGKHSGALEKFHEASEVDPYDPDPVYQSGTCLLELGGYGKGREAFEAVERLAPGWFRCRSDRWLAEGLENGTISEEEFHLIRALDDGGLAPAQATSLVKQAVERIPEFAPLYLFLGHYSDGERDAMAAYRKGLELVDEPDLESRLLCALAGHVSPDAPERRQLVERTVSLNGSLVAIGTAKLMRLQ